VNENTGLRHQGERIATLESAYGEIVHRLNHLDECVDDVKKVAAENQRIWEKRWYIGIGIVVGITLLAGSGTISLKTLIDLLSKVHP